MSTKLAKAMANLLVTDEGKKYFNDVYKATYEDWYSSNLSYDGIGDSFGNIYPTTTKEQLADAKRDAREKAIGHAMFAVMDKVGAWWEDLERLSDEREDFGHFNKATVTRTRNPERLSKALDTFIKQTAWGENLPHEWQ